jgi:hypothetical protein
VNVAFTFSPIFLQVKSSKIRLFLPVPCTYSLVLFACPIFRFHEYSFSSRLKTPSKLFDEFTFDSHTPVGGIHINLHSLRPFKTPNKIVPSTNLSSYFKFILILCLIVTSPDLKIVDSSSPLQK